MENLEKNRTNFSDSIATLAEAQVRFFRGVTCFNLAKCYGGQYIIYRQLPVLGEKNHPLCSSQEGWDFIYEDLRFAAEHLPTKDKVELGCLSSGAAYGMLARAMLYAERWKEASDAAAR
ncbi:RagB/SusD family nutrient uptake outer membrane protein [Bacteroides uniformis]|nr:RagB/SusD family nutrient uptake outer membrane protein [Bacteroides uniformis]